MFTSIKDLRESIQVRASGAGLRPECICDGAIDAELAIIGEAPGEHEVRTKKPFIGSSSVFLWKYLQKYKIGRKDVYMTNVAKRRTAFESNKVSMNGHERDLWKELVLWELQQLPNLRYALLLGNVALEALTNVKGIDHWRGSLITGRVGPRIVACVPANNPAAISRELRREVSFAFDINKLHRVMTGKVQDHAVDVLIDPSVRQIMEYLDDLEGQERPVAFDIETHNNETESIAFSNSAHNAICIPFIKDGDSAYTLVDEMEIRRRVQRLLANHRVKLIAQNGMFDMSWLWYKDKIHVRGLWLDTMLGHHALYPQLPHDLGYIVTQYTDHPYYKEDRKSEDQNTRWRYNGKDAALTYAAALSINAELRSQQLDDFFFSHIMRLQPHLVNMTAGGVLIDAEWKERVTQQTRVMVSAALKKFQACVREATGNPGHDDVNPSSPKQMSQLYFSELKLVGRGTSTDEENRKRMYNHPRTRDEDRAVLNAVDEYAGDRKFLGTYATMVVDEDGRARSEYKQTGVQSAPGRLSSAKTLWGSGMNFQNQPDRALPMFIADPNYVFAYFDLSQAEARYVGWDARIWSWIEQFERARLDGGYDCHRALAADLFNIPYDQTPIADRDERGEFTIRYKAKKCRHGLNYRMAADRLSTTARIPFKEAIRLYQMYHRITPELRIWWQHLEQEVHRNKCLFNSYGRRWKVMERITPEALESIVAFRPQSTIGDKVCRVIYQSHDDPRWPYNARIRLNVHDALIALAPKDKARLCLSIMKKYAEEPIIVHADMPPLIIPAECGISVPVRYEMVNNNDNTGKEEYKWIEDETGMHRWSSIKKVKDIEAAA